MRTYLQILYVIIIGWYKKKENEKKINFLKNHKNILNNIQAF